MLKKVFLLGESSTDLSRNLTPILKPLGWHLENLQPYEIEQPQLLSYANSNIPSFAILSVASLGQLQELAKTAHNLGLENFFVVCSSGAPEVFLNACRLGARDVFAAEALSQLEQELLQQLQLLDAQAHKQLLDQVHLNPSDQIEEHTSFEPSNSLHKILRSIGIAARHNLNLLITGETGTGKEDTARKIHRSSEYASGPFVALNCSAIPAELFEAELFGHSEGAYTGANNNRAGFIEAAEGGSILLDEIGDLPLSLQPKLLEFLETKSFSRVGENSKRQASLRIFAATNKNLPKMINEGLFRADLYFRLNQASLHLPPLRERKEDLADLISGFIAEFNAQLGLSISGYAPKVLQQALNYSWQGNLRELKNQVRLAVLAVKSGPVLDLPLAKISAQA